MKTLKIYKNSKTVIKDFLLSKGYRHDQIFFDGGIKIDGIYSHIWRLFTGEKVFFLVKQKSYPFTLTLIRCFKGELIDKEKVKQHMETGTYIPAEFNGIKARIITREEDEMKM